MMDPPYVTTDVMLLIMFNVNNLDDVVDIALTSKQINNQLNTLYMVSLLDRRFNIIRPVINWKDLIRENSKVNPTKYTHIEVNAPDYPSMKTLVRNALRVNILIYQYLPHATVYDIPYITDLELINQVFDNIHNYVDFNLPNNVIKLMCLDSDRKFSIELFKHYINVILPLYTNKIKIFYFGQTINVKLDFRVAINNLLS